MSLYDGDESIVVEIGGSEKDFNVTDAGMTERSKNERIRAIKYLTIPAFINKFSSHEN